MQKIGDITNTANDVGEYTEGNPGAGVEPTLIKARWMNMVQRELVSVVEGAGLTLDLERDDQLLAAIRLINQKSQESFAVDTGAVNAYVCAFTPAITVRSESRPLIFKVKTSNTGPSTLNDGIGPVPLVGTAHSALQGGEVVADGEAWVQWNGSVGGGSYVLLFCSGAAQQIGPALQSHHAVQLAQAQALIAAGPAVQGSFKNLQVFTTGTSALVYIACEEAVLKDPAGKTLTGRNLFATLNMTAAGLNGLDTGAVAASSWYSKWIISNGTLFAAVAALCPVVTGNTTAGSAVVTNLASTGSMRVGMPFAGGSFPAGAVIKSVDSGTQITASLPAKTTAASVSLRFIFDPVMPPGYTYKARVSALPTDATANKFTLSIIQFGGAIDYKVAPGSNVSSPPLMANGVAGNISTPAIWVPIGLANIVSPAAKSVRVYGANTTSGAGTLIVAPSAGHAGTGSGTPPPLVVSNVGSSPITGYVEMLLEEFYIYWASGAPNQSLLCKGWEDCL